MVQDGQVIQVEENRKIS
ncbi:hypothetical protein [Bacillus pumilus]